VRELQPDHRRSRCGRDDRREACADWAFLVTQWQLANGAVPTGRMSVEDVRAVTTVKQAKETAITRDEATTGRPL